MNNMVMLIGRISEIGDSFIHIKNVDLENKEQTFLIRVNENIIKNIKEYCKNGDLIGIKGRLVDISGTTYVDADKVSFLASTKKEDPNKNEI